MDFLGHLRTINEHRAEVRRGCFRLGLFYQGLTHDLSKYSPTEFLVGIKYYQGFRSPNNAEREVKGYSSSWLHHKGRNKHHYEYWTDYSNRSADAESVMFPVSMPNRYLAEMYADRVAASKTYMKEKYHDGCPLDYFLKGSSKKLMSEETGRELEIILRMLADKGELVTEEYIRTQLLKGMIGPWIVQKKRERDRRYFKVQ